jgi:hypothetical protein
MEAEPFIGVQFGDTVENGQVSEGVRLVLFPWDRQADFAFIVTDQGLMLF